MEEIMNSDYEIAKEKDIRELFDLECVKAQTDDDSIGFYRKCGFSEEKIVIEYPDGPAVRYNCVLHKQTTSRLSN